MCIRDRRQPATPIEGTVEQEPQDLDIIIENPGSVEIATDDGGMIMILIPMLKALEMRTLILI